MMRTGIDVIKIALHIQKEKNIPSPIRIPFKGTKLEPMHITAITTQAYPRTELIVKAE